MAASMKSRVIAVATERLAFFRNQDACEAVVANLRSLGASETLIQSTIANQCAMRAELPELLAFVSAYCLASDSLAKIVQRLGSQGFSTEAIYTAYRT